MSIKLLVMDVDGTLTDGKINISANGELFKSFNVKDGYAIVHILSKYAILPVIITGRTSDIVSIRAKELGVKHCYQGISDKKDKLLEIMKNLNIDNYEIAYIGDDLNDLEIMSICSIKACPSDATNQVKNICNYICKKSGGNGAVREFIEYLIDKGMIL